VEAPAPESLLRPCDKPLLLAGKGMNTREVMHAWGSNRVALADCAGRHAALADFTRKNANLTAHSFDIQNADGRLP